MMSVQFFAVRLALVVALTVGTLSVCIDSTYAEEIENPTEEQKIMIFIKQLDQDFGKFIDDSRVNNSLNVSSIDEAHLKDYEKLCISNQIFSVAYPLQLQKVKKRIFSNQGQKKGTEILANMDLLKESDNWRDKACALAYGQFVTTTAISTDAMATLMEQGKYDEVIKLLRQHQGMLKKFQGIHLVKTEQNVLRGLIQMTGKSTEETLSMMEQLVRVAKLEASKNKQQ